MNRKSTWRSTSFRLALLYTGLFAVSMVLLGGMVVLLSRATFEDQLDARIAADSRYLTIEYRYGGLEHLREELRERMAAPGQIDFALQAPDGEVIDGYIGSAAGDLGWSTRTVAQDGLLRRERLLVTPLPGGYRLLAADDLRKVDQMVQVLLETFGWALLLALLVGGAGAMALGRGFLGRIDAIARTAQAITEGDLDRRAPVSPIGDDLDQLAHVMNGMMDRMQVLIESFRQVSNDVAHDLRTPLTRLRNRLEAASAGAIPSTRAELEAAIAETDSLLAIFDSLLRIAQVESRARTAGFESLDLSTVASAAAEAFEPSAADAGFSLTLATGGHLPIRGDRSMLLQALANLIENCLLHTPVGGRIEVSTACRDGAAVLQVRDTGSGIPEHERLRVLDRFYRLERSRTTPGSGLGLALVRAAAALHDATLHLEDATPGLIVRIAFPLRPASP